MSYEIQVRRPCSQQHAKLTNFGAWCPECKQYGQTLAEIEHAGIVVWLPFAEVSRLSHAEEVCRAADQAVHDALNKL